MRRFAFGTMLALALAGCEKKLELAPATPKQVPVTQEQRVRASVAVDSLREGFNRGDCHFTTAPSDVSGRVHDSPDACRDLRETLGDWRSVTLAGTCPGPGVIDWACLAGEAQFAKGVAKTTALVQFNGVGVRVWSIRFGLASRQWSFPTLARPELRIQDPPMSPPPRNRG